MDMDEQKQQQIKEKDLAPHISVNAQYLKDFSFENPSAPSSLVSLNKNPEIDLTLDLNITRIPGENLFEVEILIEAKAMNEGATIFIVDLKYAGIFNLINIPEEQEQMLLAVHCPALIFPYARKIIADVTQDGGFQPLMIDPIDFGLLYHKKLSQRPS